MADSVIIMTPSGGQGKTFLSQVFGAFSNHQLVSVDRAAYGKSKLGRMAKGVREFDLVTHMAENDEDSDFFIDLVSLFLGRPCVVDFGANLSDEFLKYLRDGFINMADAAISNLIFVVPMTSDIQSQRAASTVIEQIGTLPFMPYVKIVAVMNEVRGSFEMDLDLGARELVSKSLIFPRCNSSFLQHFEERSIGVEKGFYFLRNDPDKDNFTMMDIKSKMSEFMMLNAKKNYFTFLKRSHVNVFSQVFSGSS